MLEGLYIKDKNERKEIVKVAVTIILIIVILIVAFSIYLYYFLQPGPPGYEVEPYVFSGTVSEDSDYWNITIDYIHEDYKSDTKYFSYELLVIINNSEEIYQEVKTFDNLEDNYSGFIDFIDIDNNNKFTKGDKIIIKNIYNKNDKLGIVIYIIMNSPKNNEVLFKLEEDGFE